MTLDELRLVFNTARVDGEDGIRAVVEALQPTFRNTSCGICQSNDRAYREILASDGVDKAAGGSTRETEPGCVEQAVPAVTPAAELSPHARLLRDLLAKTSAGDFAAALHDLGFKVKFDMDERSKPEAAR